MVCVQQACIYRESRSKCYQIEDFDGEALAKISAIELLRKEPATRSVEQAGPPSRAQSSRNLRLIGSRVGKIHCDLHMAKRPRLVTLKALGWYIAVLRWSSMVPALVAQSSG